MSTTPCVPPAKPSTDPGDGCPAVSAPSTCSGSPAPSRNAAASSPCWRRSTTASRSASPATSTSRWRPRTSSTTRAGPTSSGYAGFGPNPRPIGVAGQIIPWNFPLLMAAWKIAPALAAGNTVVLKPAETTPLTALLLAEVIAQAGLPAGVVNMLTGGGGHRCRAGPPSGHRQGRVHRLDRGPARSAAGVVGTGKRVTLELGGKAANIVFDDAPLDQAIEGIVNGIFFNQGQVCCAGSRLLVQESIAEEFLHRLKRRMATLRSATRSTRTPTSARSTPPRSSPGSASSPTPASTRAPPAGRRRASCPSGASGSRRPCSPASRRPTASPARRSSGRCSRC